MLLCFTGVIVTTDGTGCLVVDRHCAGVQLLNIVVRGV